MARITKAKQKILGLNAPSDQMAAFGSCKTGTPVYTTDIDTLQTTAYEQGWQEATDNDYAPYREEMNGVQYGLSRQIAYLQQEGLSEWIDTVTYYKGSVVKVITGDSQVWYESLQDDNTGNDPTVKGSTHWKKLEFGGSGLELCDIGMALYVDETKGLRRYLNGQIVDINTNTQAFLNRLLQIQTTNPELFTTESNWQAEASLNIDGCVYKFVLNYSGDNVVSVRLPKYPDYVEINAGGTLPVVGNGMTLGWTDGNGNYRGTVELTNGGLTVNSTYGSNLPLSAQKAVNFPDNPLVGITTDPTKSGIETTLKQTKLKLKYFIQIATGSETENNIINDIELNNPYSLFECKYADHELFNLSWLVSNGSYNGSNAVHPSAYQALLVENNAEVAIGSTVTLPNGVKYTKQGLSVKLSTDSDITDEDFVVNPADETFRLPIKPKNLNNTRYLIEAGEQDGISYRIYADGWCEQGGRYTIATNGHGTITFLKEFADTSYTIFNSKESADSSTWNVMFDTLETWTTSQVGIKANLTKYTLDGSWKASGYLAEGEYTPLTDNILLYYYVGETVQNANLIDAGRIGEQLAGKLDRSAIKAYITETYQNGTSGYRIYSDGYCEQWGQSTTTNGSVSITFVKPFNTVVGGSSAILNSGASFTSVLALTTTGCTLAAGRWLSGGGLSGTGTNVPLAWVIYGYLADGQY